MHADFMHFFAGECYYSPSMIFQKGVMAMTRKSTVATSLFIAVLLTFATHGTVLADDGYNMGVSGTPQEAPSMGSPETSGGTDNNRKNNGKRNKKKIIIKEPAPGERLTIKQITQILNTTRDLAGKNLSGLQLVGMNLSRCNLKGADLNHSNLERADFTESNLERTDFTGANLRMAGFFQSAITASNMDQAILDGAIWVDKRVCPTGSIGKCLETDSPLADEAPPALLAPK